MTNLLSSPLSTGLPPHGDSDLAQHLLKDIWGLPFRSQSPTSKLLDFYHARLCLVDERELIIKTHQDVVDIVSFTRSKWPIPIEAVEAALGAENRAWLGPSKKATKAAVDLAVQLSLMLKRDQLDGSLTFVDAVAAVFPPSVGTAPFSNFDLHFDTSSLEAIAGIKVIRTSCLSEHLRLDERSRTLSLFAHADFLRSYNITDSFRIYPPGLLEETLKTISLLTPAYTLKEPRWKSLAWNMPEEDVELAFNDNVSRNPEDYLYWKTRLVTLYAAYQKSTPTGLRQWWRDRRDTTKWTTFWLAVAAIILTLLFGLAQSITGIIQVYAAYHSQTCSGA